MNIKRSLIMLFAMLCMLFTSPVIHAANDDGDGLFAVTFVGTTLAISSSPMTVATIGASIVMLANSDTYYEDCPKSLYNAPGYYVDKGGYGTEVTACHYEINKASLSRYEVRRL